MSMSDWEPFREISFSRMVAILKLVCEIVFCRLVRETISADVIYYFLKSFCKLVKVFLVKENLVFVKRKTAVRLCAAPALRDSKEVVLSSPCRFYIKKISAFTGPYRLGVNIIALFLAGVTSIIIFPVHIYFFYWNPIFVVKFNEKYQK